MYWQKVVETLYHYEDVTCYSQHRCEMFVLRNPLR